MYKIFFLNVITLSMVSLLYADDIYDTRESAMTAMRQSKVILEEAKKIITEISSFTGSIPELGQTVTPILQQLTYNITESLEKTRQIADGVSQTTDAAKKITDGISQTTDAVQKITDKFSNGMKDINSKLQNIQSGTSNLSIPRIDQDNLAEIKSQITESLNSAGVVPAENNSSSKKQRIRRLPVK